MKMIQGPKRSPAKKARGPNQYPPGRTKKTNTNQVLGVPYSDDAQVARYGPPKSSKQHIGLITGAVRAPYPKVFRPFGPNTRSHCYPLPDTGILDNVYTWPPVRSHDPPCQLLEGSTAWQAGNPKVNEKVSLLRRSSTIWNCFGKA